MYFKDQNISQGSSQVAKNKVFLKEKFMLENMKFNRAYTHKIEQLKLNNNCSSDVKEKEILEEFKKRYKKYREDWHNINNIISNNKNSNSLFQKPLCVDIETASICDLACPHCFREYIVTPDKIMKEGLYLKIMREVKELQVPSIKLNWRGEPLLNPAIDKFIKIAKENEVIDVSINTNATTLNEEKSLKILNSGLDQIIFSFDGGTKETYEKMRPGRFKKNTFNKIYENIKNFCLLKKKLKKVFPITKIQMVMTKNSRNEVKNFYDLFSDLIDDVVITQYQERGGNMDDILDEQKKKLNDYKDQNNLKELNHYIAKADGELLVSKERRTCDQIYQRLMVTYNGHVGMCCHDWGAKHCIGYLDKDGISSNDKDLKQVYDKTQLKQKGFELLKNIKMPEKFNKPSPTVSTLTQIWTGEELKKIRDKHVNDKINEIDICKNCTYKNSYHWKKI